MKLSSFDYFGAFRILVSGSCLSFLLVMTGCGGEDKTSVNPAPQPPTANTTPPAKAPMQAVPPRGSTSAGGDSACTDSRQANFAWINSTAYTFKFSALTGNQAKPKAESTIKPGATFQNVDGLTWKIDVYDSAGQTLLYPTTAILMCNSNQNNLYSYVMDDQYKITWTYTEYKNNQSYQNMTINLAPPVVTNTGWVSGMGNSLSTATEGNSFWGIDYGDEPDRWTVTSDAIYQPNQGIDYNGGTNYGSRAFPVALGSNFVASPGPGGAKDGLWQLDIKAGTTGLSNDSYIETFYLAERINPAVGTSNYMDGSPKGGKNNAPGGWGLEIDIMETRWNAGGGRIGPQINLPTGLGGNNSTFTGWTTDSTYYNTVLGLWSDPGIGGMPNPQFVTYGALIRGNSLWIYAYKPDGSFWYSTPEIKNSGTYAYTSPLYPYIGTWADPINYGTETINNVTKTGYSNYIYLSADDPKIQGFNPYDNPDKFGAALKLFK
jgi:hypothetical protein